MVQFGLLGVKVPFYGAYWFLRRPWASVLNSCLYCSSKKVARGAARAATTTLQQDKVVVFFVMFTKAAACGHLACEAGRSWCQRRGVVVRKGVIFLVVVQRADEAGSFRGLRRCSEAEKGGH